MILSFLLTITVTIYRKSGNYVTNIREDLKV